MYIVIIIRTNKETNKNRIDTESIVKTPLPVLSIRPGSHQSSVGYSVENCYLCQQLSKIGPLEEVAMGLSYCSLTGAELGQPPTAMN